MSDINVTIITERDGSTIAVGLTIPDLHAYITSQVKTNLC